MRKQKTYNTEQAIVRDIDEAKAKVVELMAEAERKEIESRPLIRSGNTDDVANGIFIKSESKKLREQATRIETVKLVKLKNALAAFRTGTFPTVVADKQVVI